MASDSLTRDLRGGGLSKSEENLDVVASTQSFWDIGNYRKVVKRVDDSARLTVDLLKMLQERAEIEAKYTKHLNQWSKKWEDSIGKGPEYGTIESACKGLCLEAARLASIHEECQKKLDDITRRLSDWKSDHYHKSLGSWKETKKAEEGFHKAQKPWARCLDKNNKAKKLFHQLGKELDSLTQQLNTAETSREYPTDQLVKLREKREKCVRDKDRSRERYIETLDDLQHSKKHYIEDMVREFEKCQTFERQRMQFYHNVLVSMKLALDISDDERMRCVYQVLDHTLTQISPEDDLRWYSLHFGSSMTYTWPEFEDCPSNVTYNKHHFNSSAAPPPPSLNSHSSPVMPSYRQKNMGSARSLDTTSQSSSLGTPPLVTDSSSHIYESTSMQWQEPPPPSPPADEDEPAEEEEQDIETASPDNEEEQEEEDGEEDEDDEGIPMRALYDYQQQDDDDLSFKEGDIVRIIEQCDGGWAKGLLDGRFGYVPSSYFEAVDTN